MEISTWAFGSTSGGRFESIDLLWEKFPSQSPYVYSNNNPLNVTDPEGKQGVYLTQSWDMKLLDGGGGGVGGAVSASLGVGLAALVKEWLSPSDAGTTQVQSKKAQVQQPAADASKSEQKSKERAIKSLKEQVAKHTDKLEKYRANPDAYDNKGFLKNAPSAEVREKIIQSRIEHLLKEIGEFQKQLELMRIN